MGHFTEYTDEVSEGGEKNFSEYTDDPSSQSAVGAAPSENMIDPEVAAEGAKARALELAEIAGRGFLSGLQSLPDIAAIGSMAVDPRMAEGGDREREERMDAATIEGTPSAAFSLDLNSVPFTSFQATEKLKEMGVPLKFADNQDFVGSFVEILSSSVAPTGALLGLAKKFPGATKFLQRIARNPKAFITGELAQIAGATVTRRVMEEVFPESDGASAIGEVLGSFLTNPLIAGGSRVSSFAQDIASQDIKTRRASEILQSKADDPLSAAATLRSSDDIIGVEPGKLTEDQGLIALSRFEEGTNQTEALKRQGELSARAREALQSELGMEGGTVDDMVAALQKRKKDFENRMDARVTEAQKNADLAAQRIGDGSPERRAQASRTQKQIINDQYIVEENIEKGLWNRVPTDTKIPHDPKNGIVPLKPMALAVKNIKNKFGAFSDNLPRGRFRTIGQFISRARNGKLTINELKQFRTDLGSDIASELASARPNKSKLSMMFEMDNATLNVMKNLDPSGALVDAISHSRKKNELFNKGTLGKIRGFDSSVSEVVPEELTLKKIIKAEEQGIVGVSDLLDAVDSPETRSVMTDYMLGLFSSQQLKGGGVNLSTSEAWLNKYSGVLDKLPEAKSLIEEAISTGVISNKIREAGDKAMSLFTASGTKKRALNVVLDSIEDPSLAIGEISRSKNPRKKLTELVNIVNKEGRIVEIDGKKVNSAMAGLREAILDDIINKLTQDATSGGQRLLKTKDVGGALSPAYLNALRKSGIYSSKEGAFLERLLKNISLNAQTSHSSGFDDPIASFFGNIASIAVLKKAAPIITKGSGAGGIAISARISKISKQFAEKIGTADVQNMVKKAILEDKELLNALLTRVNTSSPEAFDSAFVKINNFLASSVQRDFGEDEQ